MTLAIHADMVFLDTASRVHEDRDEESGVLCASIRRASEIDTVIIHNNWSFSSEECFARAGIWNVRMKF